MISSTARAADSGAAALFPDCGLPSHRAASAIIFASTPGASARQAGPFSVPIAARAATTSAGSPSHGISRTRRRIAASVSTGSCSGLAVRIRVCVGENVIGFSPIRLPVSSAPPVICLSRSVASCPVRGASSMNDSRRPFSAYTIEACDLSAGASSRASAVCA